MYGLKYHRFIRTQFFKVRQSQIADGTTENTHISENQFTSRSAAARTTNR